MQWREWTTRELAFLDKHYPAGMPVSEIAKRLERTIPATKRRAKERGLVHPGRSSAQRIKNFEAAHGKPLDEIAREYRDRRLPRATLAQDIGIENPALRKALGDALWRSWPRMTIGRIDEARRRRKVA